MFLPLLVWNPRRIFGLIIWFGKSNILRDITLDLYFSSVVECFLYFRIMLLPSNLAGQVYIATCFCTLLSKVLPVLFIVRRILLSPGLLWLWHKRHRICLCLAIKSQCVSPGHHSSVLTHERLHPHAPVFLKARCKNWNNDPIIFMVFLKVHMKIFKEQLLIWSPYYSYYGGWWINAFTETV